MQCEISLEGSECEYSTPIKTKKLIARKPKKCCLCEKEIKVGEKYIYEFYLPEDWGYKQTTDCDYEYDYKSKKHKWVRIHVTDVKKNLFKCLPCKEIEKKLFVDSTILWGDMKAFLEDHFEHEPNIQECLGKIGKLSKKAQDFVCEIIDETQERMENFWEQEKKRKRKF